MSTADLSPQAFTRPCFDGVDYPPHSSTSRSLSIGMHIPHTRPRTTEPPMNTDLIFSEPSHLTYQHSPLERSWTNCWFCTNAHTSMELNHLQQLSRVSTTTSLRVCSAPTHSRQARVKPPGWRRHQPCVGSSAAARAVAAAMPSTSARADTPLAMAWWPPRSGRMRPVSGGRDVPGAAVLWVRALAGGRQTQPTRPQPAADTPVRAPPRHGSWPPCTPCPAAGRAPITHHTLRSVCCEVLVCLKGMWAARRCDGILGTRMTDPQAGRRRWPWLISAISRVGLLWWSGSCRHHFRTSPDFQCSASSLLVL